jgi:hypothetical protein
MAEKFRVNDVMDNPFVLAPAGPPVSTTAVANPTVNNNGATMRNFSR